MGKIKTEGGKKAKNAIFTQTGQLRDLSGTLLPSVPNMVGNCVGFHRKKMLPLKTIYLCPAYYMSFRDWVRFQCIEREADLKHEMLTWDGVEIVMMSAHHILRANKGSYEFDWDFYEDKKTIN